MTSAPDPRVIATQRRAAERAGGYHDVMREVAAAADGRVAMDDGTGIASSVKGLESLQGKVDRPRRDGAPVDQRLQEVNDLNRYTVVFDKDGYTAGVERCRELLEERGLAFDPGRSRNQWDDPFYKGYNATFRDQSRPHAAIDPERAGAGSPRHPVEVQFHTPESFAAKSETHDVYELVRSGRLSRPERAAAQELRARRNDGVEAPPGQRAGPPLYPGEQSSSGRRTARDRRRERDADREDRDRRRDREAGLG